MKRCFAWGSVAVCMVGGGVLWYGWKEGEPRRASLAAVERLHESLTSGAGEMLLQAVILPQTLRERTPQEQVEFLRKTLADELSAEGVAALRKEAAFGPLREIFPSEAGNWAKQAGVPLEECVAFQLERSGVRTEVVLARRGSEYRIVRCNNVKQTAMRSTYSAP